MAALQNGGLTPQSQTLLPRVKVRVRVKLPPEDDTLVPFSPKV